MWTLTLDLIPLSMNERERAHWMARKRELDAITEQIGWLAREARIPAAEGRRCVTVTIHKSMHSRVLDDHGNLHARAKSILDACVKMGLLIDDNPRYLEWGGVVEGPKRASKQTVIQISECVDQVAA